MIFPKTRFYNGICFEPKLFSPNFYLAMVDVKNIVSGFHIEMIARAVDITSGAILTILLARGLGSSEFGRLSLALSVLSFAFLGANLGFPQSGARYITESKEENPEMVRYVIQVTVLSIAALNIITGLILFFGAEYIETLLSINRLSILLIVGIFYIVFKSFAMLSRRLFQSFSDIKGASKVSIFIGLMNIPIVLFFLHYDESAIGVLSGYTISFGIASAVFTYKLFRRHYVSYDLGDNTNSEIAKKVVKYNFGLAATSGARAIEKKADILMIGFFLSPASVGIYTVAKRIASKIREPAVALGVTLSPKYSEERIKSGANEAGEIYREALEKIILLYFPAVTGLMIISKPTLTQLFGPSYAEGAAVLQVLAFIGFLEAVGSITASGLDYLGRARSRAILKIAAVGINILANWIMIPEYGIVGAAFATAGSYTLYMAGTVYVMHSELEFFSIDLITYILKVSVVTAVMAIPVYQIINRMSGLSSLVIAIATGVVIWGLVAYYADLIRPKEVRTLMKLD